MEPRTKRTILVLVLLSLVAVLLLWLALRTMEGALENARGAQTAEPPRGTSVAPKRPGGRAAVVVRREEDEPAAAPPAAADAAQIEGWPACDVVVRHPDGRPAPGAIVYARTIGAQEASDIDLIPRATANAEGRARLAVAAAGAYDVGAFLGAGVETLVRDVTFPASRAVEVVLPELADLRLEGDAPPNAWVTVRRADADEARAYPGRRQGKYAGGSVPALPLTWPVPRGVPLRIDAQAGLVAEPARVTAPATVVLRQDGSRDVVIVFRVRGPEDGFRRPVMLQFEVTATAGSVVRTNVWNLGIPARATPSYFPWTVRLPPETVVVRWKGRGVDGVTTFDASATQPEHGYPVDVVVPDLEEASPSFRIRIVPPAEGKPPREVSVTTVHGQHAQTFSAAPDRETWCVAGDGLAFLGVADDLVAGPARGDPERMTDVRLVRGGSIRIVVPHVLALGASFRLGVARADGLLLPHERYAVFSRQIAAPGETIGPFAPGPLELVFTLGGREIGRTTTEVRAGETVDAAVPVIRPPLAR